MLTGYLLLHPKLPFYLIQQTAIPYANTHHSRARSFGKFVHGIAYRALRSGAKFCCKVTK
jgi:hypothetical protein